MKHPLTIVDDVELYYDEDNNEEGDGYADEEKLLFAGESPRRRKRNQDFTFARVHWISCNGRDFKPTPSNRRQTLCTHLAFYCGRSDEKFAILGWIPKMLSTSTSMLSA